VEAEAAMFLTAARSFHHVVHDVQSKTQAWNHRLFPLWVHFRMQEALLEPLLDGLEIVVHDLLVEWTGQLRSLYEASPSSRMQEHRRSFGSSIGAEGGILEYRAMHTLQGQP
jgi:hypothetical protein